MFLTGTAAEVTPVREIDHHRFQPGEITRTLLEAYAAETGQVLPQAAPAVAKGGSVGLRLVIWGGGGRGWD